MDIRPNRFGRRAAIALSALMLTAMSACGEGSESSESDGPGSSPGPTPDEMCTDGSVPQAAAYALADGTFLWASCTEGAAYRYVTAVTDDAVYVAGVDPTVALDPADGSVVADAPPPPPRQFPTSLRYQTDIGEVQVTGSQDGPVAAHGADGTEVWSQPGVWVYSDVWAIDDDAVFAIEREASRLVAYEIATGAIRWEHVGDPYLEGLWPWHAEGGHLFTAWSNLQVRDTGTGELQWATTYPPPLNPALRLGVLPRTESPSSSGSARPRPAATEAATPHRPFAQCLERPAKPSASNRATVCAPGATARIPRGAQVEVDPRSAPSV